MPLLRLLSLPAVRRKAAAEISTLLALAAALVGLAAWARAFFPGAPLLLAVVTAGTAVLQMQRAAIIEMRRGFFGWTRLESREASPALWDAVHAVSAAAGIRPPRIYLLEEHVPFIAASWGLGSGRSVGVKKKLIESMPPAFVAAMVAHEIAHMRMRDLEIGNAILTLIAGVRWAGVLLVALGFAAVLTGPPAGPGALVMPLLAAVAGLAAFILMEAADVWLRPRLSFLREYAADAASVAFTGDVVSTLAMLALFAKAGRDRRLRAVPRPGTTHPPPLARMAALIQALPRPRRRR